MLMAVDLGCKPDTAHQQNMLIVCQARYSTLLKVILTQKKGKAGEAWSNRRLDLAAKPDHRAEHIDLSAKPDTAPAEHVDLSAKPDTAPEESHPHTEEGKEGEAVATRRRRYANTSEEDDDDDSRRRRSAADFTSASSEEHQDVNEQDSQENFKSTKRVLNDNDVSKSVEEKKSSDEDYARGCDNNDDDSNDASNEDNEIN
ncbi:hypothetical protein DOY81_014376 [Sarcophaga bullata]|nr:hypothetical protein DOY81_014376 [Sarcophaga bullata]